MSNKKWMIGFGMIIMAMTGIFILLFVQNKRIMITAHRGDQVEAPENTIPAFVNAIKKEADYIELDVTETKDGTLVIIHDDNLLRTTGCDKNIWEVSYEEVELLDAGSYKGAEFVGTKIPTLQQVLKLCKGKIKLNIELKYNQYESDDFVEKVISAIEEEDMVKECMITSFHYEFIEEIKVLRSSFNTGYIFSTMPSDLRQFGAADNFSVYYNILDKNLVSQIHDMGKEVHVWTVNEEDEIRHCLQLKVDNIITNDVEKVKMIIK